MRRDKLLRKAGVLRESNFRRFYAGYTTSLLGTAMSAVALSFAVLDNGGTATDLGLVFAAGIVPQVVFILHAGVIADRLGRRPVMLTADLARFLSQGVLAVALFAGRPPIWLFAVLSAARGAGDAFFRPALSALTVEIAKRDQLGNANAMLSLANSTTSIAGPALAGILIAVNGPATVIALDAATFGASALALSLLRLSPSAPPAGRSFRREVRQGWVEFRSRPWLLATTVGFTLFNLVTWGPYLLLGPVLSREYLGGARAWGIIMAGYGTGAVLGGLLALGRRPHRPVFVGVACMFGYSAPPLLLALHASLPLVALGALVAGTGSALGGAFQGTAVQQQVPAHALARVGSLQVFGSFSFGPLAFAAAGPVAAVVGTRTLLAFGAAWSAACVTALLAVPDVRRVTWRDGPADPKPVTTDAARTKAAVDAAKAPGDAGEGGPTKIAFLE